MSEPLSKRTIHMNWKTSVERTKTANNERHHFNFFQGLCTCGAHMIDQCTMGLFTWQSPGENIASSSWTDSIPACNWTLHSYARASDMSVCDDLKKRKKNNNEHQIKSFESESRQMNYELNSAWASVLWFTLSTLTRMHFSPVNVTISLFALICHPNKSFDCSSIFIIEAIMVDLRPHLIYFVACVCLCWLWINFLLFLN